MNKTSILIQVNEWKTRATKLYRKSRVEHHKVFKVLIIQSHFTVAFVHISMYQDEECFYQCEPMLGYFESVPGSGYISGVPVCASYCDSWFEACKDDLTCVEDWLDDFDYAVNGNNSCPVNSTCTTFRGRYGDAKGLCNKMWGSAFVYSTDEQNCTVMKFDPGNGNPNFRLTFPAARSAESIPVTTANAVREFINPIILVLMISMVNVL